MIYRNIMLTTSYHIMAGHFLGELTSMHEISLQVGWRWAYVSRKLFIYIATCKCFCFNIQLKSFSLFCLLFLSCLPEAGVFLHSPGEGGEPGIISETASWREGYSAVLSHSANEIYCTLQTGVYLFSLGISIHIHFCACVWPK